MKSLDKLPYNLPIEHSPDAVLSVVPELGMLHMHIPGEEPADLYHIAHSYSETEMASTGELLSHMNVVFGQRTAIFSDVRMTLGIRPQTLTGIIERLKGFLPESYLNYDTKHKLITLGAFAVAFRQATEADRKAQDDKYEQLRLASEAKEQQRLAELEAADPNKQNFANYYHMLISDAGARYYLALDSPAAILGARTLHAISEVRADGVQITVTALTKRIWNTMPLAERRLFTTEKQALLSKPTQSIAQQVDSAVKDLATTLGVTTHRYDDIYTVAKRPNVQLQDQPLSVGESAGLAPLLPPGTPKDIARSYSLTQMAGNLQKDVKDVLTACITSEGMDHQKAVSFLDVIFNKQARAVAMGQLVEQYGEAEALHILDTLDQRAYSTLGHDRYAVVQDTWSMHTSGSKVRQVGGELPGTSFWHLGENVPRTSRWTIGNADGANSTDG